MTAVHDPDLRRLSKRLSLGVAAACLVWLLALTGCGDTGPARLATGEVNSAGDECILAGGIAPEKLGAEAVMSGDGGEKAYLPVDSQWKGDYVQEGTWEKHRMSTKTGYYYVIELCAHDNQKDDPDLYISRNTDPYTHLWRSSGFGAPLSDTIVFKAAQDGVMYIAVRGYNSSDDDQVSYYIRVSRWLPGQYTG